MIFTVNFFVKESIRIHNNLYGEAPCEEGNQKSREELRFAVTTPAAEMCTGRGAGALGVRELPLEECQSALPLEDTDIEDKGVQDRETGWQKHKDATEPGIWTVARLSVTEVLVQRGGGCRSACEGGGGECGGSDTASGPDELRASPAFSFSLPSNPIWEPQLLPFYRQGN